MDFAFDLALRGGKFGGEPLQQLTVHHDALVLHGEENRHQRPLQRFIDRHLARLQELLAEQHPQAERDVGIFGGIVRGAVKGHAVEGHLRLARACHLLVADRLVAEMALRQFIHAMADIARLEGI